MNKTGGDDGLPVELFQILKNDAVRIKCYTQYASKFGKLSNGHRTGKGQFAFQSQRKAILRILSITLLACEMSAIVRQFEHSLALPFFGTGMQTDASAIREL